MKLVVLSDTHIPKKAKTLPKRLMNEIKDADLIIHAGDWQSVDVFHELKSFAKVEGVFGNVDGPEIQELFNDKVMVQADGFKIGITHGHGKGKTTEKRALQAFDGKDVDCIIFGHSHIPVKRYEDGILLFNPGSPTEKRRQEKYSFGVFHIGESLEAEHIFFT
jgi:uncharacterized protein